MTGDVLARHELGQVWAWSRMVLRSLLEKVESKARSRGVMGVVAFNSLVFGGAYLYDSMDHHVPTIVDILLPLWLLVLVQCIGLALRRVKPGSLSTVQVQESDRRRWNLARHGFGLFGFYAFWGLWIFRWHDAIIPEQLRQPMILSVAIAACVAIPCSIVFLSFVFQSHSPDGPASGDAGGTP